LREFGKISAGWLDTFGPTKAQKATREVGGGINRIRAGDGHGFRSSYDAVRCLIGVGTIWSAGANIARLFFVSPGEFGGPA